jgi:hypothetical protein
MNMHKIHAITIAISVGPPRAPGDVIVTEKGVAENGVGSLNISWSLADISLVPINFTITALNLNSSGESVNSIITQDLFQVISLPNNATSCDVYQFHVTAVNPAGANSSGFIFASFPSLPTPVTEDAVQTFLMKSANETVSLQILINVSTRVIPQLSRRLCSFSECITMPRFPCIILHFNLVSGGF